MRWGWIAPAVVAAAWISTTHVLAQTSNEEETAWQEGHNESPEGEDAEKAWLEEKERGETVVSPTPMEDEAPGADAPASERGLGTPAAERERRHRSRGRVGKSVTDDDEEHQVQFHFHGYYRARYNRYPTSTAPSLCGARTPPTATCAFVSTRR
jgi:hypothetical protein